MRLMNLSDLSLIVYFRDHLVLMVVALSTDE
ncbi:hypothetical protein NC652_022840 [Populus alba x Populus x berolinensis]|nr:hypothetical protein NC652_022840 [Populus alba x Populus x berolinensis]